MRVSKLVALERLLRLQVLCHHDESAHRARRSCRSGTMSIVNMETHVASWPDRIHGPSEVVDSGSGGQQHAMSSTGSQDSTNDIGMVHHHKGINTESPVDIHNATVVDVQDESTPTASNPTIRVSTLDEKCWRRVSRTTMKD